MPDTLSPAATSGPIAFDQVLKLPLRMHRQPVASGRVVQVQDRNGGVVALIKGAGEPKEAVANLFAASPELLEALRTTADNIRHLGPAGALGPVFKPYEQWLSTVDAAIAKAEGRAHG